MLKKFYGSIGNKAFLKPASLKFLILLAGGTVAFASSVAAKGSWEAASFPGDKKPAAQGCAVEATEELWVCMLVRCDAPKMLGLYFLEGENDAFDGAVTIVVDGQEFPVTVAASARIPINDNREAKPFSPDLLASLKSGKEVTFKGIKLPKGMDRIPLKSAAPQIVRVEKACGL